MKKFLMALTAAGVLFIGGQAGAEASTVESLDIQAVETQDMGKWSHFRDKYILGRDRDHYDHRYYDHDRDRYDRDRRYRHRRDWDDDYYRRPPRRPPTAPPDYGVPPSPGYGAPPLPPGYGAPPRR